eukprot:SM000337S12896  [mRNA]  locus=s337:43666:49844:+ [translate_table: standard]
MAPAYALWAAAHADAGYSTLATCSVGLELPAGGSADLAGSAGQRRTGGLDFGPSDTADLQAVLAGCRRHGVPHEVLTARQVAERFPAFHLPEHHVAVFCPEAGVLAATRAVAMFQALAAKHGAILTDQTTVTGIKESTGADGRPYVIVTTNRGTFTTDKCVITAGAWTTELLKKVRGVHLPVQPLHTTVAYWRTLQVSVHGGPPCDPEARPAAADPTGTLASAVGPWLERVFAGRVASAAPALSESCLYSMTPDQDFILDFLTSPSDLLQLNLIKMPSDLFARCTWGATEQLHHCFSGHGFKFGPLVGRVLADLTTTGCCETVEGTKVLLHLFSAARFRTLPQGNAKASGPQLFLIQQQTRIIGPRLRRSVARSEVARG